jgi:cathepsin D
VGSTAAIFDTGTTQIIGDVAGIAKLFDSISGAQSAPQYGDGAYTSASCATNQSTHIYVSSIP